jgi:hypothetical protein
VATNELIPFYDEGNTITCKTVSGVTGKRFVSIAGVPVNDVPITGVTGAGVGLPHVELTGAGLGSVFGVAAYDAPANSAVGVVHATSIVVPVTAGANITANTFVQSDATGRAVPFTTGVKLGLALDTVASGADCPIDRSITS